MARPYGGAPLRGRYQTRYSTLQQPSGYLTITPASKTRCRLSQRALRASTLTTTMPTTDYRPFSEYRRQDFVTARSRRELYGYEVPLGDQSDGWMDGRPVRRWIVVLSVVLLVLAALASLI